MNEITQLNDQIEALQEQLRLETSISNQLVILRELRAKIQERHQLKINLHNQNV